MYVKLFPLRTCNDLVNENYLWKDDLHLINEGSSLFLNNFTNYLNENIKNIWLMTKGSYKENNIDIKENPVQIAKERCSISQKKIINSKSLCKSNTEWITELIIE